jgi:hypothetical protein
VITRRSPVFLLAAAAVLVTAAHAVAQSCAMCGNSFGPDDTIHRAFSWSILFLMAAPYTIVGLIAAVVFVAYRRASGPRRGAVIDFRRGRRPAPATGPEGELP